MIMYVYPVLINIYLRLIIILSKRRSLNSCIVKIKELLAKQFLYFQRNSKKYILDEDIYCNFSREIISLNVCYLIK
jgi:hypothetical protein